MGKQTASWCRNHISCLKNKIKNQKRESEDLLSDFVTFIFGHPTVRTAGNAYTCAPRSLIIYTGHQSHQLIDRIHNGQVMKIINFSICDQCSIFMVQTRVILNPSSSIGFGNGSSWRMTFSTNKMFIFNFSFRCDTIRKSDSGLPWIC